MKLRVATLASWISATTSCAQELNQPYSARVGRAIINPKAVQLRASAIALDSMAAFSAGATLATAAKAPIIPETVPNNPKRVAKFEINESKFTRLSTL